MLLLGGAASPPLLLVGGGASTVFFLGGIGVFHPRPFSVVLRPPPRVVLLSPPAPYGVVLFFPLPLLGLEVNFSKAT